MSGLTRDRCPVCNHPDGAPVSHGRAHEDEGMAGAGTVIPAPVVLMPGRGVSPAGLARGGRTQTPGGMADLAEANGWRVRASVALAGIHVVKRVPVGGVAEAELDGKLKAGTRKTRDVVIPVAMESVAVWMRRGDARCRAVWRDGVYDEGGWTSPRGMRGGAGVMEVRAYLAGDSGTVAE